MIENPLAQFKPEEMQDGETKVIELKDGQFMAVKKEKHVLNGRVLEYRIEMGESREDALNKLK